MLMGQHFFHVSLKFLRCHAETSEPLWGKRHGQDPLWKYSKSDEVAQTHGKSIAIRHAMPLWQIPDPPVKRI